uniref:FERM, ARH/RhoGEF and pleckstrin domain protein 1 n=1 Tax=Oncorhynchus kisutch TaxID=8019 RepID=A0A8C7IGW4_ONCKI
MVEPEHRASAAQRLGAQETLGISTLDPGHRPPTMPPGRHVSIKIRMLDDTEEVFDVSQRASGKVVFDLVCTHLNLVEGDYFSLEYQDHHKMMVWLDLLKPIVKQLRRPKHTVLRFVVKFFPPDHTQLLEELTRYLFALQVKHDLACGRLACNDSSAALLVSHIIQSEIGDFEESQSRQHLLNNSYIPDQVALIDRIMEFHSKNVGQTPAESDYQLLEVARRLELYGVRLHPAKDREGSKLSLAVAHTGVLVFQGHTKINAFNWSKVRKLSFKRKRFLIKLRPDLNQSSYQDTLEFLMGSRDCCKVFWKICVEYHAFFRLFEEPKPKPKPVLFTRGSSFRFSGRTQKQVIDYVKDSEFKKIPFERKHSRVQHSSSRLSPLPSPHRPQVPKESVSRAPGDIVDSPPRRHWKESVLVSAEDPSALRTRSSPSSQRNGAHSEERPGPGAEPGPARQPHPEHLNTGPASRGAKGSSSSIPYIDCSDIDSEYDVAKGRVTRSHPNESYGEEVAGPRRGSINERELALGRMRYMESPPSPKPPLNMSRALDESGNLSFFGGGPPRGPLHSTMMEDLGGRGIGDQRSSSPLTVRHMLGSKSTTSSPVMSTFHRTGSLSHADQNGYGSRLPRWDEPGHGGFNARGGPGGPRDEGQAPPNYGSYSPIVARSPHLQKLHNMRNRSDTDPFVLSPQQATSTPSHDPRPVVSRNERMAALERRMMANGLSAPGQPKPSPLQKLYSRGGVDHIGAVQMIDGSTSSGTESSDSETETTTGSSSSHPLTYGNPMAMGVNSSPMPRNKYSFGSLQLDEELEEDGCLNFSDEDGAQVFSC